MQHRGHWPTASTRPVPLDASPVARQESHSSRGSASIASAASDTSRPRKRRQQKPSSKRGIARAAAPLSQPFDVAVWMARHNAALTIQRRVRGMQTRRRFSEWAPGRRRVIRAARLLQRIGRSGVARGGTLYFRAHLTDAAACDMQRIWRAWVARKRFAEVNRPPNGPAKREQVRRRMVEQMEEVKWTHITAEAVYSGLIEGELSTMPLLTTLVAVFSDRVRAQLFMGMRRLNREEAEACDALRDRKRILLARHRRAERERAVLKLQSRWRGKRVRMWLKRTVGRLKADRERAASVLLQAAWRGTKARQWYHKERKLREFEHLRNPLYAKRQLIQDERGRRADIRGPVRKEGTEQYERFWLEIGRRQGHDAIMRVIRNKEEFATGVAKLWKHEHRRRREIREIVGMSHSALLRRIHTDRISIDQSHLRWLVFHNRLRTLQELQREFLRDEECAEMCEEEAKKRRIIQWEQNRANNDHWADCCDSHARQSQRQLHREQREETCAAEAERRLHILARAKELRELLLQHEEWDIGYAEFLRTWQPAFNRFPSVDEPHGRRCTEKDERDARAVFEAQRLTERAAVMRLQQRRLHSGLREQHCAAEAAARAERELSDQSHREDIAHLAAQSLAAARASAARMPGDATCLQIATWCRALAERAAAGKVHDVARSLVYIADDCVRRGVPSVAQAPHARQALLEAVKPEEIIEVAGKLEAAGLVRRLSGCLAAPRRAFLRGRPPLPQEAEAVVQAVDALASATSNIVGSAVGAAACEAHKVQSLLRVFAADAVALLRQIGVTNWAMTGAALLEAVELLAPCPAGARRGWRAAWTGVEAWLAMVDGRPVLPRGVLRGGPSQGDAVPGELRDPEAGPQELHAAAACWEEASAPGLRDALNAALRNRLAAYLCFVDAPAAEDLLRALSPLVGIALSPWPLGAPACWAADIASRIRRLEDVPVLEEVEALAAGPLAEDAQEYADQGLSAMLRGDLPEAAEHLEACAVSLGPTVSECAVIAAALAAAAEASTECLLCRAGIEADVAGEEHQGRTALAEEWQEERGAADAAWRDAAGELAVTVAPVQRARLESREATARRAVLLNPEAKEYAAWAAQELRQRRRAAASTEARRSREGRRFRLRPLGLRRAAGEATRLLDLTPRRVRQAVRKAAVLTAQGESVEAVLVPKLDSPPPDRRRPEGEAERRRATVLDAVGQVEAGAIATAMLTGSAGTQELPAGDRPAEPAADGAADPSMHTAVPDESPRAADQTALSFAASPPKQPPAAVRADAAVPADAVGEDAGWRTQRLTGYVLTQTLRLGSAERVARERKVAVYGRAHWLVGSHLRADLDAVIGEMQRLIDERQRRLREQGTRRRPSIPDPLNVLDFSDLEIGRSAGRSALYAPQPAQA